MDAFIFAHAADAELVVECCSGKYVHSLYTSSPPQHLVYVLVSKDMNPEITGVFVCTWFDGLINMQIKNNGHEFACEVTTGKWSVFAGPEQRKVGVCESHFFDGLLPPVQTGVKPMRNTEATKFLTEKFDLNKLFLKIKTL
jgi:hypothetical protein